MSSERKRYDLLIYKNRSFKMNVFFKDASGAATDLAGWSGFSQCRETAKATSELIFAFDVVIADATAGKVSVMVTGNQTGVEQSKGSWDLMMVAPDGYDDTYVLGQVILADVPTVRV